MSRKFHVEADYVVPGLVIVFSRAEMRSKGLLFRYLTWGGVTHEMVCTPAINKAGLVVAAFTHNFDLLLLADARTPARSERRFSCEDALRREALDE